MKLVTKLIAITTVASFMFAGMSLTWGNAYENVADDLTVTNQYGVWLDVNDSMAFGWEGSGIKVGFAGPGGMDVRLGYDTTADGEVGATLGMSRTWWTSTGDGWGSSFSTAIDFNMTGGSGPDGLTNADPAHATNVDNVSAGSWVLTMNLGFGF